MTKLPIALPPTSSPNKTLASPHASNAPLPPMDWKWTSLAVPGLSLRIPNPIFYCPLILPLLFYLFMHTGLLVLRVFPFSAVPPFPPCKLQTPNRLLHYQRPVLLQQKVTRDHRPRLSHSVNISGTPLHSECRVVILSLCLGASQGADEGGGAL
ncbi:hypothetical protein PILCRDRAFT_17536 [Piloderma croceum F 1598]|uniref:Uncharacterized protein n=1 Tax=Piloderma croceum (strain F 1598) TaxID=765440 RepID=A0A0C3ET24_PILCF|nr:hypothetical protein PILCRDRAFT_17536 [Piloderma croceum F 1598]